MTFADIYYKKYSHLRAGKYPRARALKDSEKLAAHVQQASSNAIATAKAKLAKTHPENTAYVHNVLVVGIDETHLSCGYARRLGSLDLTFP